MHRFLIRASVLALLLLATFVSPISAERGGEAGVRIIVKMTGEAERPGPGDPDGTGKAYLRLNVEDEELCYTLKVSNIEPATAAHIHVAPATDPGPVVVPLAAPTSGTSSGCVHVDSALLLDIIENPEGYYVNVHNTPFPGGAVRGQLG